jgi:mono/diheme cytochrome c family protein
MKPAEIIRLVASVVTAAMMITAACWLVKPIMAAVATESPPASPNFRPPDQSLFAAGRFVYQKNCQVCHGRFGEGDGELVREWEVLPRNFAQARFKYRSTLSGKLPTDADLERTIRRGISGSAMPIFKHLRDEEMRAVVEYLKSFSRSWKDPANHAEPVPSAQRPAWFTDEAERSRQVVAGRELFGNICSSCHGAGGAGDGSAAATLVDADGRPIKPADLRQPLRSGPDPEDVYRTIMTGITGTPMLGFAGALSDGQVWQLAVYVLNLREQPDHQAR